MKGPSGSYDWARYLATLISRFYRDALATLRDEHEDELMEMHLFETDGSEAYLLVEMHVFALRRLQEYREAHPEYAHMQLHEFIACNNDPEAFAADFWDNRTYEDYARAQAIVRANDDGEGIMAYSATAAEVLTRYPHWAQLSDQEFHDAWDECAKEITHREEQRVWTWESGRPRMTLDG